MESNAPSSKFPKKRLTRDQRRDILLMRSLNHTYSEIATFLHVTERAVQYTCNTNQDTPQTKGRGRHPKLTKEQVDELETFVRSSKEGRQMSYAQLAERFNTGIGSIRTALKSRGYSRRVALVRPSIPKKNEVKPPE